MKELQLKLPLKKDILRWAIERALHEYIRLERVLYEQEEVREAYEALRKREEKSEYDFVNCPYCGHTDLGSCELCDNEQLRRQHEEVSAKTKEAEIGDCGDRPRTSTGSY